MMGTGPSGDTNIASDASDSNYGDFLFLIAALVE